MPENVHQQEVALDYCFIRRQGEQEAQTVLVLKDRASRALRAWQLQHKGIQDDEPAELQKESKPLGTKTGAGLKSVESRRF